MNEFEMIEKLVEKTNVSFEEASEALRACEGNLVDALVYLERKVNAEKILDAEETRAAEAMADTVQTDETDNNTVNVDEMAAENAATEEKKEEDTMREETRNTKKNNGEAIKGFFRKVKDILVNNALSVTRNGEEKVRIPAWLLAIILVCCFKFSAIVLIISLFLGCRYAFVGKDDLSAANDVMDKAGDVVDKVKAQFN